MPATPSSPQKRSTRSGSSSGVTLSDIKSLIDSLRIEVINTLKDEVRHLKETISSLQSSIKALEEDNRRIHKKYSEVDAELRSLQEHQLEASFMITEEVDARLRKKCNIVISGLSECSVDGSVNDSEDIVKCADLFRAIGLDASGVVATHRLGKPSPYKPRLLKVKCEDVEVRNNALRYAKKLKNKDQYRNVFINPDRTQLERERFKALTTELKQRRANNENVVIYRDRVVKRKDITNF